MGKQYIAVETSVEKVEIGKIYAYLHKGKICVGKAIRHPYKKEGQGYDWAMENCHTGKIQYPYQMDIIVPNSHVSEVQATLTLVP